MHQFYQIGPGEYFETRCAGGGGCYIAQRKHSCFPTKCRRINSWFRRDFLSWLLFLWTELRSNPSSAKQSISKMQLVVMVQKNSWCCWHRFRCFCCLKESEWSIIWLATSGSIKQKHFNLWYQSYCQDIQILCKWWLLKGTFITL